MVTITSVEARKKFRQLMDMVQREPGAITRRGSPTAFVVSPREMEDVLDARRRRSKAVVELETWSAKATKRARRAAAKLTDEEVTRLVHENS
jgi:antitoxin Phd